MVLGPSRAGGVQKFAICVLLALASAQAAFAVANFSPQRRVGYTTGDQWEPAMAADGHGHIYILFPQYGAVNDCPACTAPTMALLVSNDNGLSWQAPHPLVASSTGQFDPQIVVDPVDRQTVYVSWLQNNKRDVMVARSQDFGGSWYLAVAEHSRNNDDADKPVLAVHGADVYVGFNHDENFLVAASHDYAQNFAAVTVNPNARPGWSLAGGATVDATGDVYFSWTAYARRNLSTRPVSIYVSRSTDAGRSWNTVLLDVSSAPPGCAAQGCEAEFLGAQIALTSDAAGTVYALWNAGTVHGGPERIYFSSSTTGGASWSAKADVSTADDQVEHCFPAITAGIMLCQISRCGMSSIAVRATAAQPGQPRRSSPVQHVATTTFCLRGLSFPSATTSRWPSIISETRMSCGERAAITSLPGRSGTLTGVSEPVAIMRLFIDVFSFKPHSFSSGIRHLVSLHS